MTDHAIPSQAPARPQIRYLVAGETRMEFDGIALRDKIRRGELQRDQQVSIVGTDDWKPASQFPALARYFDMIAKATERATPAAVNAGPIGERILPGLGYPFTSVTAIAFVVLAGLTSPAPLLPLLVAIAGSVYSLAIIRKSSEGETRAPAMAEAGGVSEWIMGFLRLVAISIISAWPLIIVAILGFMGMMSFSLMIAAGIVMLLYYPACLASIALWKRISIALSVTRIFAFISVLGGSYVVAVVMAIAAFALVMGITFAVGVVLPQRLLVDALAQLGWMWALFYASHLLGWAVCRNRQNLELS